MGGEEEEYRRDAMRREFPRWVLLVKQALNKELIVVLRAKKERGEREKRKADFLQTKRNTMTVLVKEIKKPKKTKNKRWGACFACTIRHQVFTPYREQCVREWRGQRQEGDREREKDTNRIMKRKLFF